MKGYPIMRAFYSVASLVCVLMVASTSKSLAEDKVDFVKQVQPILETSCVRCHNPEKHKNDLRLDNKADAMKGGKHGPCIVPGNSKKSDVIKRVSLPADDEDVMPAKGAHLTKAQIKTLADWIDQGANWPDGVTLQDKSPQDKK